MVERVISIDEDLEKSLEMRKTCDIEKQRDSNRQKKHKSATTSYRRNIISRWSIPVVPNLYVGSEIPPGLETPMMYLRKWRKQQEGKRELGSE